MATSWSSRNGNYWCAGVSVEITKTTDTQCTVRTRALFCSDWRINVMSSITWSLKYNGTTSSSGGEAEGRWIESENDSQVVLMTKTQTVSRGSSSKTYSASATVKVTSVSSGTKTASASVTIPARTRTPHGKPTVKTNKTTTNYGESATISWAKSSTQGNASFKRFELWQGNTKLYSGSGISKSVIPSDATGAKGGTATYKVKEIHEWYGSYPSTENTVSINVRSGVVSAYDSTNKRHTGLVTAYDANGNSHYVLITAYDSNGSPHSVV